MYARILIAIVASALAFASANAQTGSGLPGGGISTGGGTTGTGTTGTGTTGSGTTSSGMPGSSGMTGSGNVMGSSPGMPNQALTPSFFDALNYKSMTECLKAAQAANLSRDACNGVNR